MKLLLNAAEAMSDVAGPRRPSLRLAGEKRQLFFTSFRHYLTTKGVVFIVEIRRPVPANSQRCSKPVK